MSQSPKLLRSYVELILRYRWLVLLAVAIITVLLGSYAKNLRMIIDPNTMLPMEHPYVVTTAEVERIFGSKYVIVVGITPKQGDIYQSQVLAKVQRISAKLRETPGVVRENLLSLSAHKVKDIAGTAEGMEVRPLMADVPQDAQAMQALRNAVARNSAYHNSVVSKDGRTTAIYTEFREVEGGFREIMRKVEPIVAAERDAEVDIAVGGLPHFLSQIERYSDRIIWLFPLAVLIVGLIHYEAFRTWQGLILPLVTPLLAVVWGLGVMGAFKIPLDIFNGFTPILILAVGAGHAVQLLKRYYEEYHRLRETSSLTPHEANRQAVVDSVTAVGPVMLTAGLVAAIGFFSLTVFHITSVRVFGIFTGVGILGALILEMTFIPALRSLLRAPGDKERALEQSERFWDRLTNRLAAWVSGPAQTRIYLAAVIAIAIALAGASRVLVDSSTKSLFSPSLPVKQDDAQLNARLGGTNTVYVLIKGAQLDAIKQPAVLRAMDALQRMLEQETEVGKTVSLADFVKRMHRAMNADAPAFDLIPDSADLIAQYLLLYSMSGGPTDFDSYVDGNYQAASITAFLKTDSSLYVNGLIERINAFAKQQFPPEVKVSVGGSVPEGAALTEVLVGSKIWNIVQIAGVVFLISSLVFRSVLAGVLVLTPLLLAVLVNFGLMGLTGIKLNIPTSLISAMAVGIGADYAIYLLYRMREEWTPGADEAAFMRKVLATAGKASLFVASAVAGGYAVQLFSFGFYPHTWNAILIACAMLVSVTAALTLLPALVLKLRPRFVFNGDSMHTADHPHPLPTAMSLLAATLLVGALAFAPSTYAAPSVGEIMEKNFIAARLIDSAADASFILTNKSGQQRVRKTFGTTKLQPNGLDNMRMTRFLAPADIKGTVSLLIERGDKDDDMWIYLPAMKKVRRMVASEKKSSFVGTDFSYGDVMGHKVAEWEHKLLREEAVDGVDCYVIESTPKTPAIKANTGYSKRVNWIRKEGFVTEKGELYDEAGTLWKKLKFVGWNKVDAEKERWSASELHAQDLQSGHSTIIKIENLKVNQGIKDDYFTTRYMEQP